MAAVAHSSFPAFAMLFGALYMAYGVESPFLPAFFGQRGLMPNEIGLVLTAGTIVRLTFGPLIGSVADWLGATRVLGVTAGLAGTIGFFYLGGHSFWPLLLVCMMHSVAVTPLSALSDALALVSSAKERTFTYSWVRGVGSGAFIVGTLASGRLVAEYGLPVIIPTSCGLFLAMMICVWWIPRVERAPPEIAANGIRVLLANGAFRRVLLVAGLVIGSHAMSDTFAVIQWRKDGIGVGAISLLWSEAVMSEVFVFFLVGPQAIDRLGAPICAAIAASAGILRWSIFAVTSSAIALMVVQSLHGLTFALMHLACMRIIAELSTPRLAATAQSLYGTLCLGIGSAILTYTSGVLYGRFGASAFWLMVFLCFIALPMTATLGVGATLFRPDRWENGSR